MARIASWKRGLRRYLATSVKAGGPDLTVADLMDRFGDQIPLHHAARKWASNYRGQPERALPPAYKMRFYTLTQYLHWLQCTFDPPGRKSYQTIVIVHPRLCPRCGEPFVNEKNRTYCGTGCNGKVPT